MKSTKLIIVEGIPGSGKTTAAKHIKEKLDKTGVKNELFNEGNLDHPADFEGTACLTREQFEELINRHSMYQKVLESKVDIQGENYFLYYGKLRNDMGQELPEDLFKDITKYDVCDGLSLEKYEELTLERWRNFTEKAERGDIIYIFECCFIQNPAVIMLARHYTHKVRIIRHIMNIESIISKLNPILFYFYQDNVRETIEKVAEERDKSWINFVIDYICSQAYGKELGLSGFDGVVRFFEARKEIELEVIKELGMSRLLLDNSERHWESRYKEIEGFLKI